MPATALLVAQERAIAEAYAAAHGVATEALVSGRASIVERPEPNWGYIASGATFAGGTFLAVAPELLEVARELAADAGEHRQAISLPVLDALADAAERTLRRRPSVAPAAVCWALARVPDERPLPAGWQFEAVGADWLNERTPSGDFPNGCGRPDGRDGRSFRNREGLVLRDPAGEPAAVVGVFDTNGLDEVGVDVAAEHQGSGLGAAIVGDAVRRILARGGLPFYACNASNVRSMRTALSVGFVPVCADASLS